jgi:hypothetical protein
LGFALEITKDDRRAVLFRKAIDLFIQDGSKFVRGGYLGRTFGWLRLQRADVVLLPVLPFRGQLLGFQSDPKGYLAQPAGDGFPFADRASFSDQGEERRLEGVLGVLFMAQHAAADVQNHRPVTPNQDLERRLIALADETLQ